jgi:hypothetical protein
MKLSIAYVLSEIARTCRVPAETFPWCQRIEPELEKIIDDVNGTKFVDDVW